MYRRYTPPKAPLPADHPSPPNQAGILAKQEFKADRVMTPEEYAAMPIIGWHQVCKDFDGFGNVGVRFSSAN
jgi:hypothetical protein